jgi:hypothetical protein
MKILQKPISAQHKSAMFFDGIIATQNGLEARTFQDGEVLFIGKTYIGYEIRELGEKGLIDDNDIDNQDQEILDIRLNKFIAIYKQGSKELWNDNSDLRCYVFDNYDDALEVLKQL